MKTLIQKYISNIDFEDRPLILISFLFPLLLSTSIFLTDLLASIAGLILIYIFIFKINLISFLTPIKNQVYIFLAFFFIILISLFFSDNFKNSFLPSFFYFRYFLFTLVIYYLFKKYEFMNKLIIYSLFFCFTLIMIDSIIQYFTLHNMLGYKIPNYNVFFDEMDKQIPRYVTSFFNQEKKLGSFSIRLLPFLIGLVVINKKLKYYNVDKILLITIGILIFYTSERTALFLYIFFLFYYLIISNYKFYILIFLTVSFGLLLTLNPNFHKKYIQSSLTQLGFLSFYKGERINTEKPTIRYYSKEHEDLAFTGIEIFKRNPVSGSGIKNFYSSCKKLQKLGLKFYLDNDYNFQRQNYLTCSTHPHSTYIQILSDTGFFGFLIISFIFFNILYRIFKIIINQSKITSELSSYYFLSIGIIINLLPLVPSGSFFNNWISFMIFYPLGYWLYLHSRFKDHI